MSDQEEIRRVQAHKADLSLKRTLKIAIELMVVVFIIIPLFGAFILGFYNGLTGR